MRIVILLIGLVFGATAGFLFASGAGTSPHDHGSHADSGHDPDHLATWSADTPVPDLSVNLIPDTVSGQNVQIVAPGFTYDAAAVGSADVTGTGHAHVYINGAKWGRLYSDWVHLPDVVSGDEITVTLNGNSHRMWSANDTAFLVTATVP